MTDQDVYAPRHGGAWDYEQFDDGAEEAIASLDALVTGPLADMPAAQLDEPPTTLLDREHPAPQPMAAEPVPVAAPAYATQVGTSPSSTAPQNPVVPPTIRRPSTARPRTTAPVAAVPSRPYDDVPEYEDRRRRRRDSGGERRPSFFSRLLAWMLRLIALVPRLAGIGMCGLVVAAAIPSIAERGKVVQVLEIASRFMPDSISGLLVTQTPFGGAFRGDFALAALILFIVDWAIVRLAAALEQ